MFYFLFMILMFYIFGKLFFFGIRAAWGISKFILMFDMLAGRLEIFPMLMLFAPISWKRQ